MRELFIKYLNNQCSPGEVKVLLAYFNVPENEKILRELITESLENVEADDDGSQFRPATDRIFAEIKKQLVTDEIKVVPLSQRTWFRVAAAVILLAGGFALHNSVKNTNQQQDLAKADTSTQEIGPGSNKAVLTLADGSTVTLETALNGRVAQQGKTNVLKQADGQLTYKSLSEKPTEVLFNSIVTPRGGQYRITLSDGSLVWLNSASILTFPSAFVGNERRVKVTGEAYFEVAKNASTPFKVEIADKGEVEVLGTHFNVNAYHEEATANTTLLEGRVKVMVPGTGNSQIINPGEQAQLHGNGQISVDKKADTTQALAWKNGSFNFSNADLGTVFRQLSRWYDVDIKFEGPVQKRHFAGEIARDLKLSQVLKLLEKNNVFCRLQGKTLIVLQNRP